MTLAHFQEILAATLLASLCAGAVHADEVAQMSKLKPGWTEPELKAFAAGCTNAMLIPAKQDYAAATEKDKNPSPKPFPEVELLKSVEPMCACIARRVAEIRSLDELQMQGLGFAQPFVKEALSGGRCKPEGLLGRMISAPQK